MNPKQYDHSRSHPSMDRRSYNSRGDDHYNRRSSPSSARRSSSHDYRRRSPPTYAEHADKSSYNSYRGSPPRDYQQRSTYRDRDDERYVSPHRHRRSRSRSSSRSPPRRERTPPPSREIILEGLPKDMSENDIKDELVNGYHIQGLKEIRVIRDRQTGISRQFGFIQFKDVHDSIAFYSKNQPNIRLYGNNDGSTIVHISYTREREERREELEWICTKCSGSNFPKRTQCYRCHVPKPEFANTNNSRAEKLLNNGDSDASMDEVPSQFLLFRGLEASVTEEMLARGALKLLKSYEEPSKKTNSKTMSTSSSHNFGASDGSLRRVFIIRERHSDESWRFGFVEYRTLEDSQAAISKFHALQKFTIASKAILVSYIHAGVFVPAKTAEDDRFVFTATNNPSVKLSYWDQRAYANESMIAEESVAGPKSDTAHQTISGKDEPKAKKRKMDSGVSGSNKKAVPSHLQVWTDRQAELHSNDNKSESLDVPSYSDTDKNCCLLCFRQFKTIAEVNNHERLSQLHRANLSNDQAITKALHKMKKRGIAPRMVSLPSLSVDSEPDDLTGEYRDRARERRQAWNQPTRPTAQTQAAAQKLDMNVEEISKPKTSSKGASLLGKMGWSEGQGLGATGSGMVAPIATDAYAQGVGLGAEGGKLGDAVEEADKRTRGGYGAFVERAKEGYRARWENMKDQ